MAAASKWLAQNGGEAWDPSTGQCVVLNSSVQQRRATPTPSAHPNVVAKRWASVRHVRRHTKSTATVQIHVREMAQLYNALDPSPFWDRDLDHNAAEFIEGEFRERHAADLWHLVIRVRTEKADAKTLQKAVESYYDRLVSSARRELKEHLRGAQLGLLAGLVLFGIFMGARALLHTTIFKVPAAVDEGLMILAWLTLWRPAETLAYEWVPLYRRRRLYQRLRAIRVSVRGESTEHSSSELPQAHIHPPGVRQSSP